MSSFYTEPQSSPEEQQRLQEMAASELQFNIQMLEAIRNSQQETPCQTFYKMKKSIPLSIFLEVYPFNELVDCSLELNLEDLMELKRLYSTLEQSDQQFYVDSFRRLQQLITNKIPGSYGKGFQPWKEQVAANQEVQDVLGMPEQSQEEIDDIAYRNYMQTRIPSPAAPPPVPSLFSRVKNLLSLGGGKGRKTSKKILRRQKRSKSRSKKSHSKKSRSKSRSKK
jgi:hypothetical protein